MLVRRAVANHELKRSQLNNAPTGRIHNRKPLAWNLKFNRFPFARLQGNFLVINQILPRPSDRRHEIAHRDLHRLHAIARAGVADVDRNVDRFSHCKCFFRKHRREMLECRISQSITKGVQPEKAFPRQIRIIAVMRPTGLIVKHRLLPGVTRASKSASCPPCNSSVAVLHPSPMNGR